MRDAVDFQREVARFSSTNAGYIVDALRGVYKVMGVCDTVNTPGEDSEFKILFGDFIEALDQCDSIEIVRDEEFLVDEL